MFDPNFRKTVVLVVEHEDDGAVGLILNRRSETSVAEASPVLAPLVSAGEPVFVGGPVQPDAVLVLAEFGDVEDAGEIVLETIGFPPAEADPDDLRETTSRARVFAGYAGWSPGQLEAELAGSDWLVEEAVPDDVFAADPERLWKAVVERKGGPFRLVGTMPADPWLN